MAQLFMEERRRIILETLKQQGRVAVRELSEHMDVSAVTIRQDLSALEAENLLKRTHGGAVEVYKLPFDDKPELPFDIRRHKQIDEKTVLAQAASALIESGSAIAFDASTTVCSLIPFLANVDSLTVVTNNLMATELLLSNPRIEVLLPAGKLRRDAYSIVGDPASLPDINLNIGFMSAWGISQQAGLTEVNEEEMHMKTALLARCFQKVLLVDSSKWGQVAAYTYANPQTFDTIFTTTHVPLDQRHFIDHPDIRFVEVEV